MTGRLTALLLAAALQWALPSGAALAATASAADADTSLQRGARLYLNLCRLCHDMKYLQYRDLGMLGFSAQELETLRHGRPANASLHSTTPAAVSRQLFGMEAPDLSLMARARRGGADYIYRLLTGYYETGAAAIDNRVFPHIGMPDVLGYSVEPDARGRAAVEEQAHAVSAFLEWAAEPRAGERRRLGYFVMAYLVVLTVLLYLVKNRVWRRLE